MGERSAGGQRRNEVGDVLARCEARAVKAGEPLAPVASQLRIARLQVGEPMRLAVAGQIKRGKSTLVNALLGEEVAATGQLELTFTVSEFSHGADRAVYVKYKDGTRAGPMPPGALTRLTVRDPASLDELRKIRLVEYTLPNELLRSFHLVDTPGLGSVHVADAENTMDFLGISAAFASPAERAVLRDTLAAAGRTGADVHQESMDEVSGADAVLYLFSRGMHEGDLATITEYLGPQGAQVTPVRAFGVLSRCDELWPPGPDLPGSPKSHEYNPMAAAEEITRSYLAKPEIGRLFYTMVPVAGKIGIGARQLGPAEFGWLDQLAAETKDEIALARCLYDLQEFANLERPRGTELPLAARGRLADVLGGWGTFLACGARQGGQSEAETRDRLIEASGIGRLRDLITSHFGNRAASIKLGRGLADITMALGKARAGLQRAGYREPDALRVIAARIERLRTEDHSAAEFGVLSAFYNGELTLSGDEATELLTLTGEFGATNAARLGLPASASPAEQAAAAGRLAARWAVRELDPTLNRATLRAASVMRRGYERILSQVAPLASDEESP